MASGGEATAAAAAAKGALARRRDVEAEMNLPPGFRFHPTDEELVVDYLCARVAVRKQPGPIPIIAELDLYRFDPWELPEQALLGRRAWYFFTPRDRKYPNGTRPKRAAGTGYWKATGADKPVEHLGKTVGVKKALVFYHGKPPRGLKTDWIMHEYRLPDSGARPATITTTKKKAGSATGSLRLDDWVLCRLYHKKNEWEKTMMMEPQAVEKEGDASLSRGETLTPELGIDEESFPAVQAPQPASDDNKGTPGNAIKIQPKEEEKTGELSSGDWFSKMNFNDLNSVYPPSCEADFMTFPLQDDAKMEEDDEFPFF